MTEYDPARDGRESYEEAIRELRAAYLLERKWLFSEGRWETAREWQDRTRPLVKERRATPEDVRIMLGAAEAINMQLFDR